MGIGIVERYSELIRELGVFDNPRRAVSRAREAELAGQLDELWNQMTAAEQAKVRRRLGKEHRR